MGRVSILSKILTLSYPKYRLFVFVVIILLLAFVPVSFLESVPDLSICSRILGDYCYSVGITRGVASLLKGQFSQAIDYNFLSIPVAVILFAFVIFDTRRVFIGSGKV